MDGPTEQDRIYVLQRILGASQPGAAKVAGYSARTGRRREQEAWYADLSAEVRAELVENERKGLDPLVPKAWEVIGKKLAEDDAGMAAWVLEKRFGKATQSVEQGGEIILRVVYDDNV